MKISIVIPNFNGKKLLRRNLPAVLKAEGVEEVIIADDGSSDESVEEVKSLKLKAKNYNIKLKIIENKKNLGFSSTVNRGVKEAVGEMVVLLNTDVSPEENFLNPLISHFQNPQVFAVGCLDKSIENGETILRGRGVGKWERGFLVHSRGEVDKSDTLWVSGGSGIFRKDLWEKLGGLDEIYNPFYWEDIDLSYRAQKAGYKVLFEPKSVVIHRHEEGAIRQKYSLSKVKTIAYRNQFVFVWKNISDPAFLLDHLFWLPYHLLKTLLTLDFAFMGGLLTALLKFPQIIQSRMALKKLSVKTDREILANFEGK